MYKDEEEEEEDLPEKNQPKDPHMHDSVEPKKKKDDLDGS